MDNVYYSAYEKRLVIADTREGRNALDFTGEGKVKNCYLCEADFCKALYCTLDFFSSALWLQENGRWSFQELARTYSPLGKILVMVQFVAPGRSREGCSLEARIRIPFNQHCWYRLYSGGSQVLDLFLTVECFLQGALDYFLDIKFRRPLDLSFLEIPARNQFLEKWSKILAAEKSWIEKETHQNLTPARRSDLPALHLLGPPPC